MRITKSDSDMMLARIIHLATAPSALFSASANPFVPSFQFFP